MSARKGSGDDHCDFCGRKHEFVPLLMVGRTSKICNVCICDGFNEYIAWANKKLEEAGEGA